MAKPSPSPLILIAEDELALGELLVFNLEKENFRTKLAGDGKLALDYLRKEPPPDLLLLDWMLPGPSGLEICKAARTKSHLTKMPILMLTARSDEKDIIAGLDAGADDYLTKPFSQRELMARIRALLRRTQAESEAHLTFGDLKIEPDNYNVFWQGENITLSPTAFRLLCYLAARPKKTVPRETLLDEIWGEHSAIQPRTVDANIKRLRTLLHKATGQEFIQTAHGFGYFFEPN